MCLENVIVLVVGLMLGMERGTDDGDGDDYEEVEVVSRQSCARP